MQAIANFSPKTGFEPMASAFSAVMLYQLSYEDPYVGSRQTNLSSSSLPVTVSWFELREYRWNWDVTIAAVITI